MSFFAQQEFDSPDAPGSGGRMSTQFIEVLNRIRREAGIPFVITSGFRTVAHNTASGGSRNSAHLRGLAVDIRAVSGSARHRIVRAAMLNGIRRIGIASNFVHLDIDDSLPNPSIWTYQ